MAVPTISSTLKKANLKTLVSKENTTPKASRKNILCPASQIWPRVTKHIEDSILATLIQKLISTANVFKHVKKEDSELQLEKTKIRSQLQIGSSSVFRALEQDSLACVLVSGHATPALTVDHIISLARDRDCPLLCLDQLAVAVARATQSKCLPLAIGFKKMEEGSVSNFSEVIALVREHATIDAGHKPQTTPVKPAAEKPTVDTSRQILSGTDINKHSPMHIDKVAAEEILRDLKLVLSVALATEVCKEKSVNKKNKKKPKKKKNLKDAFDKKYHNQFDIGKRTVTTILERGKMEVILVSTEIVPVLSSETQSFSLLTSAAANQCPVIILPGLMEVMRDLSGGSVSVLGLKKASFATGDEQYFQKIIEKCLLAAGACQDSSANAGQEVGVVKEKNTQDDNIKNDGSSEERKFWAATRRGEVTGNKQDDEWDKSDEEEDYSHLYVMKEDSTDYREAKQELQVMVESSQQDLFKGDFISLAAPTSTNTTVPTPSLTAKKPKTNKNRNSSSKEPISSLSVSNKSEAGNDSSFVPGFFIDVKRASSSEGLAKVETPLFSMCRSGDSVFGVDTIKDTSRAEVVSNRDTAGSVLGSSEIVQPNRDESRFLHLAESHKTAKKARKRKLQSDTSFMSFAYTEANIQTMVSNPSKKKHKKKKKKSINVT